MHAKPLYGFALPTPVGAGGFGRAGLVYRLRAPEQFQQGGSGPAGANTFPTHARRIVMQPASEIAHPVLLAAFDSLSGVLEEFADRHSLRIERFPRGFY